MPRRTRVPRPYLDSIPEERIDAMTVGLWVAPAITTCALLLVGFVVPALVALLASLGFYAVNGWRLLQRVRGRAPWKIRASTPPTEFEHGRALAWAVTGTRPSEQAVHECADAIHFGTPPDQLRPGPPLDP